MEIEFENGVKMKRVASQFQTLIIECERDHFCGFFVETIKMAVKGMGF